MVQNFWPPHCVRSSYRTARQRPFCAGKRIRHAGTRARDRHSGPPTRLVPVAEIEGLPPDAARLRGSALAVERFDRASGGRRIHMEDFAQVFGLFPDDKYGETQLCQYRRSALGGNRRGGDDNLGGRHSVGASPPAAS